MCLSAHRHKKNRVLLPDIKSSGRTLHSDKGLCTELKFRLHKQGPYKCCSAPQNKTTALSLCCDTTRLFKGSYFISASQPLEDMLKEKCAFGQEKLGRGVSCECFFLFREGDEQESPSFSWPSEGFWSYRLLFFFFFLIQALTRHQTRWACSLLNVKLLIIWPKKVWSSQIQLFLCYGTASRSMVQLIPAF